MYFVCGEHGVGTLSARERFKASVVALLLLHCGLSVIVGMREK